MDKKDRRDRRCGFSRRTYNYADYIPERRNGQDRRNMDDEDSQSMEHEESDPGTESGCPPSGDGCPRNTQK